jgi:hypothetical protein
MGYQFMHAPDEAAKNLNGFSASLFVNVTGLTPSFRELEFSLGGEFSGEFGSKSQRIGTTSVDTSLHRFTYLFGPQFNLHLNDKVKVFVHPLFGGVHDTTRATFGTSRTDFSANAFAMAFGGGVDVKLNRHFAIRPIQFDYVPTHFGGEWQNNFRFSAGVVFKFGGKR